MSENLFSKLVRKAECKVIILLDSDKKSNEINLLSIKYQLFEIMDIYIFIYSSTIFLTVSLFK